jgi:pimeloyl-ACP methyl ester carboxylesterase
MPYAENNGTRIYYEVEGRGPPVVMGHGGSNSLEMWRNYGYTDILRENNQLILFDFRGHGKSDKPHEPGEYGPEMAEDIVAILDSLGILKAHYVGYSLGATAGYTLAVRHPDRFTSFILGGVTPYEWPDEMVIAANTSITGYRLRITDPDAYIRDMENLLDKTFSDEEKADMLAGDAEASIAVLTSLLKWPPLKDSELAGITAPCFLYCGDQDPFHSGMQKSVEFIQRARFLSMEGFNHITAFAKSEYVLPYISAFLRAVARIA